MDDLKIILQRIADAEEYRAANYEELWRDCYRRYRSRPLPKEGGSNIFVPYTFMQQRVIVPRLAESLFSSRPYVSCLPREGSDAAAAVKMQQLLDWQLEERVNLRKVLSEGVIESMATYGTGIAYTGWQVKMRRVKQAVSSPAQLSDSRGLPLFDEYGEPLTAPKRHVVERNELVYDDPVVREIDLFDFFCDPTAADIETARYCGHSEYMTKSQLDGLCDQGVYDIDWRGLKPVDESETAVSRRLATSLTEEARGDSDPGGRYLVHHYWEDGRYCVIINRSVCALDGPNPFWHGKKPYDKCCFVGLPGEFYGVGIAEISADLQDELNAARNQRIDYATMTLRRMWKLRKGSGLSPRDLLWRQGGVIELNEMDDLAEINVQGIPAAAFADEDRIKADMRDATGCHDIVMGLADADETATGVITRDNNSSIRFKAIVAAIERDLLLPIAEKCVLLNCQFMSRRRVFRLLGEEGGELLSISPAEIEGQYDLIYRGTALEPAATREANKQRAMEAYSLAAADPAYQQDTAARLRLFKRVLQALDIKDTEELLPNNMLSDEGILAQVAGGESL